MSKIYDSKYRSIKEIGSGGFGKVFLAKEERSNNLVAIKQLKKENNARQENIIHEMQMISRFNHPHIVQYKHHFIQDDLLYIVMEYCSTGSLKDAMLKEKIGSSQIWKWMSELTETIEMVHKKGIVHHDIKPDNILFTENRTIKLTDFGVANTGGGTKSYMSPEALAREFEDVKDPRIDIYALGVTLLELLTNQNPFLGKSREEILDLHDQKKFGISELPNWEQEIILKSIAKIPELRFQSMKDFNEAIIARSVPIIFDQDILKAGKIAEKAEIKIYKKKWKEAFSLLEYAENNLKPNINVLIGKGRYYLLNQQLEKSKQYFERALQMNPRLDVQKELGWINLEQKNYPTSISLLSDHLHRKPSDYEAYNLLLQCYYETNRYETAILMSKSLLEADPKNNCFANNYYISLAMNNIGQTDFKTCFNLEKISENPFINYNQGIIQESQSTHSFLKKPTLKSKLLFMDYRFNKYNESTLYCTNSNMENFEEAATKKAIIKFGRGNYEVNDVKLTGSTEISRRHCVIINYKDDIWLYDLSSTGTYVNGKKVENKMPLIGKNTIRINKLEFEFTNDKTKLL